MSFMRKIVGILLSVLALEVARAQQVELYLDKKDLPAGLSEKIVLEAQLPAAVDATPRFFASVGELSPAERIAERKWRASLTLPPLRYPYLVLVAAKVPGWTPAWGAIRLHAPVRLPVKTDKPRVSVTLVLGGRQYGPVRTDDEGNCQIDAEVWPGEFEALAHGVDEFGNKTQQRVEIPIPASVLTLVFSDQASLPADGQSTADLWVLQVHPDGRPVDKAQYALRLGAGKLVDTVRKGPGVFRSRLQAPRGRQKDRLVCEIIDKRQPQLAPQVVQLVLTSGTPHSIKVELSPPRLFSDGQEQALIKLLVLDRGENPVEGFSPSVKCPAGTLGETKLENDAYQVYFLPESGLDGVVTCSAEAGGVRSDFSIMVRRPRVAFLEATTQSSGLSADGTSQAIIAIQARGENGRPLTGAEIKGSASLGTLSKIIEDGEGRYHAVYTAPAAAVVEKVRLEFSAEGPQGPQLAWLTLRLEPPPPPPPPVPRLGVGVRGGLSANFDSLSIPAAYLEAFFRLPFGKDILFAGLEGGYLFDRSQRQGREGAPRALVELDSQQLAAVFQARLRNRSRFLPFVDVGAGATLFFWRIKPEGPSERGSELAPLVFAGAGSELRLGSGAVFIQARFCWTHLPGGELGQYLSGNLSGLQVLGGLRYFVF